MTMVRLNVHFLYHRSLFAFPSKLPCQRAQAVSSDLLSGLLCVYDWWTSQPSHPLRLTGELQVTIRAFVWWEDPWKFSLRRWCGSWYWQSLYRRWLRECGGSKRASMGVVLAAGEILRGTVKGRGAQWSWFSCPNAAVLNQEWFQPPKGYVTVSHPGRWMPQVHARDMGTVHSTAP